MNPTSPETPAPGITVDGAKPGTVVHVIATDPAAPLDWCHMAGHHYVGPVPNAADLPVYALRIAAGARPPE
ncbi:sulfurtransferase TusA family protein [Streptomyces sp. NPDC090798]|uniref:sulfurtransferase TusA family protein n=1 Tax=Streptomyces sp. NPDC090798 TaxID=3365968 RepID=UPI0038309169